MTAILFVRIKSSLFAEEFERRLLERRPRIHEVPGPMQKVYGRAVAGTRAVEQSLTKSRQRANRPPPLGQV